MDTFKHYSRLVRKAQNRVLTDRVDKHHIFPRSIFGENNHLVSLTEREHYVAHLFLWDICKKRYGKDHEYTKKMATAVYLMGHKNSYFYEEQKSQNRVLLSTPEVRQRMSKSASVPKPHKQGTKFWNNGVENRMCKECPGEGWVRGRMKYTKRPFTRRKPSNETRAIWRKQRIEIAKTRPRDGNGRFTKTT
jgi:hypothetical protein